MIIDTASDIRQTLPNVRRVTLLGPADVPYDVMQALHAAGQSAADDVSQVAAERTADGWQLVSIHDNGERTTEPLHRAGDGMSH